MSIKYVHTHTENASHQGQSYVPGVWVPHAKYRLLVAGLFAHALQLSVLTAGLAYPNPHEKHLSVVLTLAAGRSEPGPQGSHVLSTL